MVLIAIIGFIISSIVLVKSANVLINSAVRIASYLKVTQFTVGFVVLAIGTSLPELFVAVMAGLSGEGGLAVGNVIGSNLADLCIVGGVIALLRGKIVFTRKKILRDTWIMLLVLLLIPTLMLDGGLNFLDGLILLSVFALYVRKIMKEEAGYRAVYKGEEGRKSKRFYFKQVLYLDVGILMLLVSSHFVVRYGIELAGALSMPPILIGLTIVSIGTSLPELSIESRAVLSKQEMVAMGDLLGSAIINTTLVLGIVALLNSVHVDMVILMSSIVFMLFAGFLFAIFIESENTLTWKEGLALVFLYLVFLITELNVQLFVERYLSLLG